MPIYPYSFQLPPLNVQDIPNDGVPGEFLGISAGGQLDWLPAGGGGGSGDMLAANNLSELTNFATARTNIGLGTASTPTFANLTLTSPSLSSSAPVTISQTWGTTGTYTAFKVVANETAVANTLSNVLELWSGNAATLKLSIRKSGQIVGPSGTIAAPTYGFADTDWGTGFSGWYRLGTGVACSTAGGTISAFSITHTNIRIGSSIPFGWTSGTAENALDTILLRDGAANTLALRNGANTQTFNVYGSYGSISDYKRLSISCDQTTGNATITNQAAGYTAGTVSINGVPVGRGKNSISTNIAIGTNALSSITTGADNIAIGTNAMLNTASISNCVGIGSNSVGSGSSQSVGIGSLALQNSGNQSVGIGYAAVSNASAGDTVGIGWASLYATQATHVVALGTNSGRYIANGSTVNAVATNSIFIGGVTKALDTAQTNQIVIGYDATGIGSNSVVLGNDSITKTALKGNVGIGTTSPTSKLHVAGDGLITGTLGIGDTGTSLKQFVIAGQPISNSLYLSSPVYIGLNAPMIALMNGGVRSAMWDRLTGITLTASSYYGFNSHETDAAFAADTILRRDGEPYHLALRNGTNGQKFSVYGTYPGAAWERFTITAPTSGNVLLGTYRGTGGIARGLEFQTDGVTRMTLATNGVVTFPISIVVNSAVRTGFINNVGDSLSMFSFVNDSTGTSTYAVGGSAPLMRFGGTTTSFPAIKRSSTTLQTRLADDSAFAPIQGKLTTDTAFTSGAITDTGYIVLYDSTGTAYKVACTPV